ncbi:MAG: hypothetical protein WKF56_08075 [Candidatus Limnocylindrales bacterium]
MPADLSRRTPSIRAFPAADRAFAEAVRRAVDEARASGATDLSGTTQQIVRFLYPNTTIVVQEAMAQLIPGQVNWYAYRDGRVRATDERRERLLNRANDDIGARAALNREP